MLVELGSFGFLERVRTLGRCYRVIVNILKVYSRLDAFCDSLKFQVSIIIYIDLLLIWTKSDE